MRAACSNCTLLELKLFTDKHIFEWRNRSNCTLLELKRATGLCVKGAFKVQIVPCWNWNKSAHATPTRWLTVQIVPCWNWNTISAAVTACSPRFKLYLAGIETTKTDFNPLWKLQVQIVPCWNWNFRTLCTGQWKRSSNCTLLELKLLEALFIPERCVRSNCTLLELKLQDVCLFLFHTRVQIVPCWNWNVTIRVISLLCSSSNCTLLELKLRILKADYTDKSRSNCTLLELKLPSTMSCPHSPTVQIVPCWNWNNASAEMSDGWTSVQIVPCWNWNPPRLSVVCGVSSVQIVPCWNWNNIKH